MIPVNGRNGESAEGENSRLLTFTGSRIAEFRLPYGGKERRGSIGIDFTLYQSRGDGFILVIENWSRRPGGRNFTIFETFNSLEEIKEKEIYGDFYTIELPAKLISGAEKEVKKS